MIKKITLLFVFTLSIIIVSNAQSVTVLEINGVDPTTFFSSNNPVNSLPTGTSIDIKISYINLSAGNIIFNMKAASSNSFSNTISTPIPSPGDTNANEMTIAYTASSEVVNYDFRVYGSGDFATSLNTFITGITVSNSSTLSSNYKDKLTSSFYNASIGAIVINEDVSGDFSIYDITGKAVIEGKISPQINVKSLNSGIYIITTAKGVLKFAK